MLRRKLAEERVRLGTSELASKWASVVDLRLLLSLEERVVPATK